MIKRMRRSERELQEELEMMEQARKPAESPREPETVVSLAERYGHGSVISENIDGCVWFLVGINASHMFYLREDGSAIWKLAISEDGERCVSAHASLADVGYIGHF